MSIESNQLGHRNEKHQDTVQELGERFLHGSVDMWVSYAKKQCINEAQKSAMKNGIKLPDGNLDMNNESNKALLSSINEILQRQLNEIADKRLIYLENKQGLLSKDHFARGLQFLAYTVFKVSFMDL